MKLYTSWLAQAMSDVKAAQMLADGRADRCQVAAKCQQASEKTVKGLVHALVALGVFNMATGSGHAVSGFARAALNAVGAAPATHRDVKQELPRIFRDHVLGAILALDGLAPRYPGPGQLAEKNTEYPYQADANDPSKWRPPSDAAAFGKQEVDRFVHAIRDLHGKTSKLVSGLERAGRLP